MIRRPACRLLAALSLTSIVGAANGPIDPTRIDHAVRLACVGDSITFGAGVKPRSTMAYPAQLGRMLGKKWEVGNFGVSGATLLRNRDHPYHKTKAYARAIAWKPDVVVIKLGTNDSNYPGNPGGGGSNNWRLKAEFGPDAKQLVADFRVANPKVRVFIGLSVPAFPGRWNIDGATVKDEIGPILKAVATENKCDVIDLYTALAPHKKFFPDTVHPNAEGATVIAQTVYHALTGKSAAPKVPVLK